SEWPAAFPLFKLPTGTTPSRLFPGSLPPMGGNGPVYMQIKAAICEKWQSCSFLRCPPLFYAYRCQPLFPPNWWDSNPLFSEVGKTRNHVAPFLKHQFSKRALFFYQSNTQNLRRQFVGHDGPSDWLLIIE